MVEWMWRSMVMVDVNGEEKIRKRSRREGDLGFIV